MKSDRRRPLTVPLPRSGYLAIACALGLFARQSDAQTNGLVLHFTFEEMDGSVVYDHSGFGNNGHTHGGQWIPINPANSGFSFQGGSVGGNTVHVLNSPSLASMQQTRQLTLAMWLKPRSIPVEFPNVLCRGGGYKPSAYGGYQLALNSNGDNDMTFVSGNGVLSTRYAYGRWINDHIGEWVHVAVTIDSATGTGKFYWNGRRTNDEWYQQEYGHTLLNLNFAVTNDLYVGGPDPLYPPAGSSAWFDGCLDDLRIYNRVLSDTDLANLYDASKMAFTNAHALTVVNPFSQTRVVSAVDLSPRTTVDGSVQTPIKVETADIDGDGDPDLLATSEAGNVVNWYMNLDGRGLSWGKQSVGSFYRPWGINGGDIDGDGDIDVAMSSMIGNRVAWWENVSSGQVWNVRIIDSSFLGAAGLAVADVNDDGRMDVVAAGVGADAVAWWKNLDGKGLIWEKHVALAGVDGALGVDVADVDGDGAIDLVGSANNAGEVYWLRNVTRDGLLWSKQVLSTSLIFPSAVRAADINGDGLVDVVAGSYGKVGDPGDVLLWENIGSGASWRQNTVHDNFGVTRAVDVADLDLDGNADIVAASSVPTRMAWWRRDSTNRTGWIVRDIAQPVSGAFDVKAVDLNHGGGVDVVACGYNLNCVSWWKNTLDDATLFNPPADSKVFPAGDHVQAISVSSHVARDESTRFACSGWSRIGSDPGAGSGPSTGPFAFTNDTTIAFTWSTQYWLNVGIDGVGAVSPPSGWHDREEVVSLTATSHSPFNFKGWSGDVPALRTNDNPLLLVMDSPKAVTARFVRPQYALAIRNPFESTFVREGASVVAAYQPPSGTQQISASLGLTAYLTNTVLFGGSATRYACSGWRRTGSDPGAGTGGNTGPFALTNSAEIVFNWSTQHWVSVSADAGGSVSPTVSGWQDAGTNLTVTARASGLYRFGGWSGDVDAAHTNDNPLTLWIDRPRSAQAHFYRPKYSLVIRNPLAETYVDDFEIRVATYRPPVATNRIEISNNLTAYLTNTVLFGSSVTRYACAGWRRTGSDPGAGAGGNTGPFALTNNAEIVFSWSTQHWVSVSADTGGTVSPPVSGWQNAGTNLLVGALPIGLYRFGGWSGDVEPAHTNDNPLALRIDGPRNVLAHFYRPRHSLVVSNAYTTTYVDEFAARVATFLPPATTNRIEASSNLTAYVTTTIASSNLTTRVVLKGWSRSGSDPKSGVGQSTGRFTLTNTAAIRFTWGTQHRLNVSADVGGYVDGAPAGWKDENVLVHMQARPAPFFAFGGWAGDVPAELTNSASIALTMDRPRAVHARFLPGERLVPLAGFAATSMVNRFKSEYQGALTGTIQTDMSGVVAVPGSEDLMVVTDDTLGRNYPSIQFHDRKGVFKNRVMGLMGFNDTEGICEYDAVNGYYAVCEEGIANISIIHFDDQTTNVLKSAGMVYPMGFSPGNRGIEGVAYDRFNDLFYAIKQDAPLMVYWIRPLPDAVQTGALFNAQAVLAPHLARLSDVVFDPFRRHLLILGQSPARVVETDLSGKVIGTLPLISVDMEGMTLSAGTRRLHTVGEPNNYQRFMLSAPVAQAREGQTVRLPVMLSVPSANPVSLAFTVTGQTARAGWDFSPGRGTVQFAPGVVTNAIEITVHLDGEAEPAESLEVVLSGAVNAEVSYESRYRVEVQDSDSEIAGFGWGPIGSPKYAGVAFPVRVEARNPSHAVVTTFDGRVKLGGWQPLGPSAIVVTEIGLGATPFVEIQNVSMQAVGTAGWQVAVSDSPTQIDLANSVTWALSASIPPGAVQHRTGAPRSTPYFGAPINWPTNQPGWAMVLDGGGQVADFVAWGWPAGAIQAMAPVVGGVARPVGAAFRGDGASDAGEGSLQRGGARDRDMAADFVWTALPSRGTANVGLLPPLSLWREIGLAAHESGNFAGGVWEGEVTVLEVTPRMLLQASDEGGHVGESELFRVDERLVLRVPIDWLREHGLTNQPPEVEEHLDADGDGMLTWEEYEADTDPTNRTSLLAFTSVTRLGGELLLRWQGGREAVQRLERSGRLGGAGSGWQPLYTNEPPTLPLESYSLPVDTNRVLYYRIRAERP